MRKKMCAYTQWTADTELAFVLALRLTGSPLKAAGELGRSFTGAYKRRQRVPDFATRWDAALADFRERAAAAKRAAQPPAEAGVMPNRVRFDGFTPVRQRAFLRALTESGKVEEACAQVGVSDQAAYHHRRCYPSFAAAWDRALVHAGVDLEQIALERAIDGVEEPVFHAGKQVGTRVRYSDPLMRKMIDVRARQAAEKAEAKKVKDGLYIPRATEEETNAAIFRKLAAIERRQRKHAAEEAVRLLEAGLIP
ncbi:MAG: hypothetical protein V4459_09040 [Pseudomonadota bacterium]